MSEHEGDWQREAPDFDHEAADLPETPAEAVAKLLEYVTAERNGSDAMRAGAANLIRLIPIAEQMPDEVRAAGGYINVWLRSSDQLPMAIEYAEGSVGYGRIEATLAEINTDMDESIFAFAVPDGAEILQATDLVAQWDAYQAEQANQPLDFEPLTPTEVPAEARAEAPEQIRGALVQRYNLPGGDSFFVAQGTAMPMERPAEATSTETITVRGAEATLFTNETNNRTLLTWSEADVFFVIGGDLSAEEATTMAESLQ